MYHLSFVSTSFTNLDPFYAVNVLKKRDRHLSFNSLKGGRDQSFELIKRNNTEMQPEGTLKKVDMSMITFGFLSETS